MGTHSAPERNPNCTNHRPLLHDRPLGRAAVPSVDRRESIRDPFDTGLAKRSVTILVIEIEGVSRMGLSLGPALVPTPPLTNHEQYGLSCTVDHTLLRNCVTPVLTIHCTHLPTNAPEQ